MLAAGRSAARVCDGLSTDKVPENECFCRLDCEIARPFEARRLCPAALYDLFTLEPTDGKCDDALVLCRLISLTAGPQDA